MGFIVLIPARYASTRLPGKPLREIAGKPLIEHVLACAQEGGAEDVIVATDDERIAVAVRRLGARVCMTSTDHASGTERLAEVVERLRFAADQIIVNLQGDEPLIPPRLLYQVADDLLSHPEASVATLCVPIRTAADLFDPNITKVVMDGQGYALYFSRAPIPWDRNTFSVKGDLLPPPSLHYRHVGLYAYRAGFIKEYARQRACPLEQIEALEQLRVLWSGGKVHVAHAIEVPGPGVDTEEDVARVKSLLS